jgi:hypothetical protein
MAEYPKRLTLKDGVTVTVKSADEEERWLNAPLPPEPDAEAEPEPDAPDPDTAAEDAAPTRRRTPAKRR